MTYPAEYRSPLGDGRPSPEHARRIQEILRVLVDDATRLIEQNPNDSLAYTRRGAYLSRRTSSSDEALADLTRAIELDAANVAALRLRSHVYYTKDKPDLSLADLEKVVELLHPTWDAFFPIDPPMSLSPTMSIDATLRLVAQAIAASDASDATAPASDPSDATAPANDASDATTPASDASDATAPASDASDATAPASDASDATAPASDPSDATAPTDASDTTASASDASDATAPANDANADVPTLEQLRQLYEQDTAMYLVVVVDPTTPSRLQFLLSILNLLVRSLKRLKRHGDALAILEPLLVVLRHVGFKRKLSEALMMQYESLRDLGRPTEALESLHRALDEDPDNKGALFYLAEIHAKLKDLGNALELFTRGRQLDPYSVSVAYQQARCCFLLERLDDALGHLRAALAMNPNDIDVHVLLAQVLEEKGEFEAALAEWDFVLARAPKVPNYWLGRAVVRAKLSTTDDSILQTLADLDQSLELNPHNVGALMIKCGCHEHRREFDQVVETVTRAIAALELSQHVIAARDSPESSSALAALCADVRKSSERLQLATCIHRRACSRSRLLPLSKLSDCIDDYCLSLELKLPRLATVCNEFLDLMTPASVSNEALRYLTALSESHPQYGAAWFGLGLIYEDRNEWAKALAAYDRAIKLRPFSSWRYRRAFTLQESGQYQQALSEFDALIDGRHIVSAAIICRLQCLYGLGRVEQLELEATRLIESDFNLEQFLLHRDTAANNTNDDSNDDSNDDDDDVWQQFNDKEQAALWGWRAIGRFQQQSRIEQARADFDRAIALTPGSIYFLLKRAVCYNEIDMPEMAIADLTAALEVNPSSIEAHYRRAFANQRCRRWREAVDDFLAVAHERQSDLALECLSKAAVLQARELDDFAAALQTIDRILAIDAQNTPALHLRCGINLAQDRPTQVLLDTQVLLGNNNNAAWVHSIRANAYMLLGQTDAAIAAISEAVRLSPDQKDYLVDRASIYERLERYTEALADRSAVLAFDTEAESYMARARLLLQLGEEHFEAALSDVKCVLEVEPDDVVANRLRAELLLTLNRHREALAAFRCTAELAPDDLSVQLGYGKTLIALGELESACECLKPVIASPRYGVEALYLRANAYNRLGNLELEYADLSELVSRTPNNPDAIYAHAMSANSLSKFNEVVEDATNYLRLVPDGADNAVVHHLRGFALSELQRYDEAIEDLNVALATLTDNPSIMMLLVAAYASRQRFDESLRHIERVVELDPENPEAHFRMGFVLAMLKRNEPAAKSMHRALELAPTRSDIKIAYAALLLDFARYTEAETILRTVLELDESDAGALSMLSIVLLLTNRTDEALERSTRATELVPDNSVCWSTRGSVLEVLGRMEDAKHDYSRAVELNPTDGEARVNLAYLHFVAGELEQALAKVAVVLDMGTSYLEEAHLVRGRVYLAQGRIDEARADLEYVRRATLEQPEHLQTLSTLASAYRHLGQLELALECITRVLAMNPLYAVSWATRGFVHKAMGNDDLAEQDFEECRKLNPAGTC